MKHTEEYRLIELLMQRLVSTLVQFNRRCFFALIPVATIIFFCSVSVAFILIFRFGALRFFVGLQLKNFELHHV